MDSQKLIHKKDFSGKSLSTIAWLDLTLSDIQEKIENIKLEDDKEIHILKLEEYVRGLRDGNRFFRKNPYK